MYALDTNILVYAHNLTSPQYRKATLKDNNVDGLYTVNVDDFKEFGFLRIQNPLA